MTTRMRNQSSIGALFRLHHSWRQRRRLPSCRALNSAAARNIGTTMATSTMVPSLRPRMMCLGTMDNVRRSSSQSSSTASIMADEESPKKRKLPKNKLLEDDGLTLSHFIAKSAATVAEPIHISQTSNSSDDNADSSDDAVTNSMNESSSFIPMAAELGDEFDDDIMVTDAMSCSNKQQTSSGSSALDRLGHQMINDEDSSNEEDMHTLKFHIKTYGCQMNVNDTDIVRAILLKNHTRHQSSDQSGNATNDSTVTITATNDSVPIKFIETTDEIQADVLLTNTCAIRENAEQKVWHRLRELRSHDRNYPLLLGNNSNNNNTKTTTAANENLSNMTKEQRKMLQRKTKQKDKKKRIIGVLGCMAERLKEDMFKDGTADVVVGPDAYRDLPRLISVLSAPSTSTENNGNNIPTERAVNVQLSLDETYASITPVRSNPNEVSAFVSIMRGCNNMCSYCVVPFTRGRERSREMKSVVEETRRLLEEEGIKEVILLGQNVNSYHDVSREKRKRGKKTVQDDDSSYQTSNDGFSNMFNLRHTDGHRFADLLDAVSSLSPELRVRFTSPHPKDYPPSLLSLMAERANICNNLHMPAQSGSSTVLERMRRGYTREAYLELIDDVRTLIPGVSISSDFITGFCGETEEEHLDTVSLMEQVQFDQAYMFAYSVRAKTHAHRTMEDDIPQEVKKRRLNEIIQCFRNNVQLRNEEVEVGKLRLVLVEGEAKRSTEENRQWSGRTDENKRVVFPDSTSFLMEEEVNPFLSSLLQSNAMEESPEQLLFEEIIANNEASVGVPRTKVGLSRGDYVVVQINEARGHTLKGQALWRSSIVGFDSLTSMNGLRRGMPTGLAGKVLMQ